MTAVKERILGALTVMSDDSAEKLWHIIKTDFCDTDWNDWDDIEEVEPDKWDIRKR